MTKKLPIAIVIPHAGLAVPSEIENRIALTETQIFNEADVYANLIYDFREHVLHWISFPYARALIDVNRPANATFHHRVGDGVVKRQSSYGDTVFLPEQEPSAILEQQLIAKYWQTWHNQLAAIAADEQVKLVLDCHSMAALGPSTYDDPAQIRPRVTASNMGNHEGNPRPKSDFISAPPELTHKVAKQFGIALADIPELAPVAEAFAVNRPFWGGWNIRKHGGKQQPWLMIEVNRGLYIGEQDANTPIVAPDETRIALLRERIWNAIETFV